MRISGFAYRAHNRLRPWAPLAGEGARLHGGRLNRPWIPALYTSLAPLTAIREAQPLGRPIQPLTLRAYEVDAEPVSDGLDRAARRALSVSESELACPTWRAEMLAGLVPASQILAERLVSAGYVGLRVRSFAPGTDDDHNLVMWQWSSERPTRVVLIDDQDRLPAGRIHRSVLALPRPASPPG